MRLSLRSPFAIFEPSNHIAMTQFNQFIPHINTGVLKELCLQENKLVLFHKKMYFLQEGEVSTHIGYVESGIFKYTTYNRSEGREYNVGIVFPGEFIADYPSCLYGMASEVNIQALTPCRVYLCPADRLNQLYETDMEHQQMGRITMEQLFLDVSTRYLDMFRLTPEERYRKLLARCPDVLQLIPVKEIASYLHITPIHLSRIRRKLVME